MRVQLACPRCGSRKITGVVAHDSESYPFKKSNAEYWKCEGCGYLCGHPREMGCCSARVDLIVGVMLVLIITSALCWLVVRSVGGN